MSIPEELKYTKEHEWVRLEADDIAVVGVTHHAQDQLGDVVFVELSEVGTQVEEGASFGTVESVKAVSDLFAPLTGEIAAANDKLQDAPELVNTDPYGEAWMIKLKVSDPMAVAGLLTAADYAKLLED